MWIFKTRQTILGIVYAPTYICNTFLKAQTGRAIIHDRDCLWGGREIELRWIQGGEASMLSVTFSNFIFQKTETNVTKCEHLLILGGGFLGYLVYYCLCFSVFNATPPPKRIVQRKQ